MRICFSGSYPYGCLVFSLYSHRDHRYLHSFPTRRSSDLVDLGRLLLDRGQHLVEGGHQGADLVAPRLARQRVLAGHQDRKSTRLNSSHVKISYAVFCLKKKKTQEHIISVELSLRP